MTTKHHLISLAFLALALGTQAQAQQPSVSQMNYQGQLVDTMGGNLPDGSYSLTFGVYSQPTGDNLLWGPQTNASVPLIGGRFNVTLGPNDSLNRWLPGVFATNQTAYLQIQVGNNSPISPRQQILSAPYAMYALQVANGSVNTAQLAIQAVTGAQIANGAVGTVQLASGAVTSDKIQGGAVGTVQLASGAVTSDKLQGGAVGNTQLASGAVTSNNIQSGAVGSAQLANDAASLAKVSGGAMVNSGGNVGVGTTTPGTALDVNGPVRAASFSGSGSGLTGIGSSALAQGAVGTDQLAPNAVTSDKILNGTITLTQLAARSVGTNVGIGGVAVSLSCDNNVIGNLVVTITTTGRPVFVGLIPDGTIRIASVQCSGSIAAAMNFYIMRDGVQAATACLAIGIPTGTATIRTPPSVMSTVDFPAAGTHTYSLTVSPADNPDLFACKLIAYEL